MKSFLFLILIGITGTINAQGECPMSYVSDYYVLNNTAETVTIWVNNRNQESFPTKGPLKYVIAPNTSVKVADLEWAGEFRDPTHWFVFKVDRSGLTGMCDKKNWKFEQLDETKGVYRLTLEPTNEAPCEELDEALYFTDQLSEDAPIVVEEEIFDLPEIEAQFPGGAKALNNWIQENIQYPQEAMQANISGKVYVEFVVEKSGELSNFKILRSSNDLLGKEALRLIKTMPNWEPAGIAGQVIRSRYRLPILFRLN